MSYTLAQLREAAERTKNRGRKQVILDILSKPHCSDQVTVLTEGEEYSIREALKEEKTKPMS